MVFEMVIRGVAVIVGSCEAVACGMAFQILAKMMLRYSWWSVAMV